MKISDVEAIPVRVPGIDPEALDGSQDDVIIRVHTDEDIEGIGEVEASPEIVKAVVEAPTSHGWSTGLRKLLIGENPLDVERLWEKMYRGSIWNGRRGVGVAAISGIDVALWDILGKAKGKPIMDLLRGKYRTKIKVYASLYTYGETPEEVKKSAENAIRKGFHAMKLDGPPIGQDEKLDNEILAAVHEGIGHGNDLMVDPCEPGWDLKEAVSRAHLYSRYSIYFLEAPFGPDDLGSYGKLCEAVDLRIACGEHYTTRYEFKDLIEKTGIDIVQPDLARAGGITEVRRIAQIAEDRGVSMIPHCWKTGISIAANLHLLSGVRNAPYLEFSQPLHSPLRFQILKEDFEVKDGLVEVPRKPGLGIELDERTIEKYRVTRDLS